MKYLKQLFLLFVCCLVFSCNSSKEKELPVLVVRGGHYYDTPDFENMCLDLAGVKADLVMPSHFFKMETSELKEKYKAVLFLSQNKHYKEYFNNKKKYLNLTKEGVGIVFLNFTISSYPHWDTYHNILGAKYFLKPYTPNVEERSVYSPKITLELNVLDKSHPVTRGLDSFTLTDAFCGKIWMAEGLHPLLGVNHEDVSKVVAWTHEYQKSRVVYIMPGYYKETFQNTSYKKLIENALCYVAKDDTRE
ncbi:ThuA domain-containing protein [Wenyingzhuangia sp. IMCC45574]